MLMFQSRLHLLEKVHEKFHPPFFFSFTHIVCILSPNCSSFEKERKKEKKAKRNEKKQQKTLPACLERQTGSGELMCLLKGSDILALQEVQLQHRQVLQMLGWFGSVRFLQPPPTDGPNATKLIRTGKQSLSKCGFSVQWRGERGSRVKGRPPGAARL